MVNAMNYDHGATLNAQAGAMEEQRFTHSMEIDELVAGFLDRGIFAGGIWHYKDDALCEFYSSDEYGKWLQRSREPNPTETERKAIAAEYEQIMEASIRHYVETVIDPLLARDIEEDAA